MAAHIGAANNTFINNTAYEADATDSANGNTVTGNVVGDELFMYEASGNAFTANVVGENLYASESANGTTVTGNVVGASLHMHDASGNTFTGNVVVGDDLYASYSADGNTVTGNVVGENLDLSYGAPVSFLTPLAMRLGSHCSCSARTPDASNNTVVNNTAGGNLDFNNRACPCCCCRAGNCRRAGRLGQPRQRPGLRPAARTPEPRGRARLGRAASQRCHEHKAVVREGLRTRLVSELGWPLRAVRAAPTGHPAGHSQRRLRVVAWWHSAHGQQAVPGRTRPA